MTSLGQSLPSQPLSNLTNALIKFHEAVPTIHNNAESFHGNFANLSGVLSNVGPALRDNGLVVSQLPEEINGQPGLRTTLMHTSGEHVSAVTPLSINNGKNGTQEWGKAVTYTRRYALLSVLGLCVGIVDNDGDADDVGAPKAKAEPAIKIEGIPDGDQPLTTEDRNTTLDLIGTLDHETKLKLCQKFRARFNLPPEAKVNPAITDHKHMVWIQENV